MMLGIHVLRNSFPTRLKTIALCIVFGLACVGVLHSQSFAAEVYTLETEYTPGDNAVIQGTTFWGFETVTLQVTLEDGTLLSGDGSVPWNETASAEGSFETYWAVAWDYAGNTLKVTAEGLESGNIATAVFVSPSTSHNQLQNDATPEWANGNINSSNACYSEGRSVGHRFFGTNQDGGTEHTLTLRMEWTKGGVHAYDYFTDYDFSESGPISSIGGVCSDISTPPPGAPDSCVSPDVSYPFPDFLSTANYTGTIPTNFFTTVNPGFVLDGPRNLYAYNVVIDSMSKYFIDGTSDQTLEVTVYYTVAGDTTGSVGFFWGGHLAEGSPDAWFYGNGSASVSGAPYHMSADFDGGNGPDRSIQTGGICLAPNVGIISDSATVCDYGSFTYIARDTASTATAWTWTVTNGTIIGSNQLDSVVFTVNSGLSVGDTVYVSVESCDTLTGCPGDYCCAEDVFKFPNFTSGYFNKSHLFWRILFHSFLNYNFIYSGFFFLNNSCYSWDLKFFYHSLNPY